MSQTGRVSEPLRPGVPDDLPVVERTVVRLVVLDTEDRLLLFDTRDPTEPGLGTWWELPGGGLEPGEGIAEAAVRELFEETGLVVRPDQLGTPSWRRVASFRYRGERRLQHESVLVVRLDAPAPALDTSHRTGFEAEDYPGARWWQVADVIGSSERFYPGRLPELLPALLAGEPVDEPFELWS